MTQRHLPQNKFKQNRYLLAIVGSVQLCSCAICILKSVKHKTQNTKHKTLFVKCAMCKGSPAYDYYYVFNMRSTISTKQFCEFSKRVCWYALAPKGLHSCVTLWNMYLNDWSNWNCDTNRYSWLTNELIWFIFGWSFFLLHIWQICMRIVLRIFDLVHLIWYFVNGNRMFTMPFFTFHISHWSKSIDKIHNLNAFHRNF